MALVGSNHILKYNQMTRRNFGTYKITFIYVNKLTPYIVQVNNGDIVINIQFHYPYDGNNINKYPQIVIPVSRNTYFIQILI